MKICRDVSDFVKLSLWCLGPCINHLPLYVSPLLVNLFQMSWPVRFTVENVLSCIYYR